MGILLNRCAKLEAAITERMQRETDEVNAWLKNVGAERSKQFLRFWLERVIERGWMPSCDGSPYDLPNDEKHAYALLITECVKRPRSVEQHREEHIFTYELWQEWIQAQTPLRGIESH